MILNLIIVVIGVAGLCFAGYLTYLNHKRVEGQGKKPAALVWILGFAIIAFGLSFTIIPTGYTGVLSTFGQISDNTLPNGFNFRIPLAQEISLVNNKQQDMIFESEEIVSETLERNTVTFSGVTVTYQINPEKSAWIAANVSNYEDNLVSQSLVASAIKTSSKTLSPIDVTNRSILEPKAQECVQDSLDQKYGEGTIHVNKVVINNAQFDTEYDAKIAQKQQAQMSYETQAIENKKNIEKAEADAKVKQTTAEAEAKANETLERSLSQQVLTSKLLDKWNGELPKATGGDGGMIFDVSKLIGDASAQAPATKETEKTE
ncbi:MAG TPA: hypothetical protein DCP06_06825 [Lachnospiraceae bacterium]|nr:hypothetical protein [Lachnospiraceae bacterium]